MRAIATVLSISLLLGACTGAPGPSGTGTAASTPTRSDAAPVEPTRPPALQAVIDAARAEGRLTLVGSEGILGGTRGTPELADRFNRQYGLELNVQYTPGASMAEGMVRLIQETQADRPAFTDVIVASPNQIAAMVRASALAPVDWASWAPDVQDPRAAAPQGVAVAVESSVAGITYNSARVRPDEVPRTMEDLLKPQYKGRIASTPYAAHFNNLAASGVWGSARTLDYVRAYADQIAGLIRCNETGRIISGEFDLFALDCGQNFTLRAKDEGAPVDFVVAADAPLLIHYYAAVPRNAAHPNAAQLWINFLLSREAQDLLYEMEYLDLAYLPGSKTAKLVEQYEVAGVTFVPIDVEFYQRIDEQQVEQVLAEVQRLLRK